MYEESDFFEEPEETVEGNDNNVVFDESSCIGWTYWIRLDEHTQIEEIDDQGGMASNEVAPSRSRAKGCSEVSSETETTSVATTCQQEPLLWFWEAMDIVTLALAEKEIRSVKVQDIETSRRPSSDPDEEYGFGMLWGE
jgi:hypothetical protein